MGLKDRSTLASERGGSWENAGLDQERSHVAYWPHHVNIAGEAICQELDEKRKCFARTHIKGLRAPHQLRQLGDVERNPSRLIATSSDGSPSADLAHPRNNTYASACPSCVVDAETFGCFMNFPTRR